MIEGHGDDIYSFNGIRMNFSSNIYPNPDFQELEAHLRKKITLIRNYPEPVPHHLEHLLAKEYGVSETELMVTSGATDAIYLIAQVLRKESSFKVFHPTFSEYADACRTFGMIETDDAPVCWLCNPNNPTGEVKTDDEVIRMAKRHKWLIIDQSYEDYTLKNIMKAPKAVAYDNIIQIRSMTKRYAIPGLRLGFIIANENIIRRLKSIYRPWAVNALAIEAGCWLIEKQKKAICHITDYLNETKRLNDGLNSIDGIKTFPTETNFFLCTIQPFTSAQLKDLLAKNEKILIRDASNFPGLTPHHFRIATQSPQENDTLIEAVSWLLKSKCPH